MALEGVFFGTHQSDVLALGLADEIAKGGLEGSGLAEFGVGFFAAATEILAGPNIINAGGGESI